MLIFALVRDGDEIYFDTNSLTCYQRMICDGIEFWLTTNGDDGYNLDFYHVNHDLFQRLVVERLRIIEQAAGHSLDIYDLLPCLPNGVRDCVGIMQLYLDTCQPWPIHPYSTPAALEKLHYLDVSNMTYIGTESGFEKYTGIMTTEGNHVMEEFMYTTVAGSHMYAQWGTHDEGIIHWGTDMESIILDIKREQLLR